jgi:hypothetical protein
MRIEQEMPPLTQYLKASLRIDTIPKPVGLGSCPGANQPTFDVCPMFVRCSFNSCSMTVQRYVTQRSRGKETGRTTR